MESFAAIGYLAGNCLDELQDLFLALLEEGTNINLSRLGGFSLLVRAHGVAESAYIVRLIVNFEDDLLGMEDARAPMQRQFKDDRRARGEEVFVGPIDQ